MRDRSFATGKSYWRSLDDLAGSPEFREFVQREFPAYASELLDGTRRHFLRIMGASLALAGAAGLPGCRRPDHKILAYHKDPEHVVPGEALFFATAMPLPGGGCEGLLAETFEGRPTKVEGNPLHPVNLGKSSALAQASVLDLYDPDRDPELIAEQAHRRDSSLRITSWADFQAFAAQHFPKFDANEGANLAFLVEKATSPSRDEMRARIQARWGKCKWYAYEAVDDENALEGSKLAFGVPHRELTRLENARVIVSLERDFLGGEGCTLPEARGFAAGRIREGTSPGHEAAGTEMSRIYVAEAMLSLTGVTADHRLPLKSSAIAAVAGAIARKVLGGAAPASLPEPTDDAARKWADAAADDLLANRGASIILAGPNQPAAIHALCHAMNAALGNVGKTVEYAPLTGDAAQSSVASIRSLCADIDAGSVDTLVVIGCNPVYSAPADADFPARYAKVPHRVHLGAADETAEASTHHVERAHYLESWSDVESWDGVYSVVQPMIQPLFGAHGELEFLAVILGEGAQDAYEIVRRTFKTRLGAGDAEFERAWKRTLHDGRAAPGAGSLRRTARSAPAVSLARAEDAFRTLAGASDEGIEVIFAPCPKVFDGRWANNGWLQELPHQITKVSWDNPALISHRTAEKLGLRTDRHPKTPQYNHAQVVTVTLAGRSVDVPVWIQPGLPDDVLVLTLGYGRRVSGRIGEGTGVDVYPLRTADSLRVAHGASIEAKRGAPPYLLACVQDHQTMEGRGLLREVDLAAWKKHGDTVYASRDPYNRAKQLRFGAQLGMESHTPANVSLYPPAQMKPHVYVEVDERGDPVLVNGRAQGRRNAQGRREQQWGMTIDLTTCTGCAACTIACQAENNIPIVGKMEVAKGREMHWIRVDRYYGGPDARGADPGPAADIEAFVQPVACVHCELAPCEVVCPVNATSHGNEGLNEMVYNRCIGTRYCNNNCPYKVRRFNWFDYGTKAFKGGFGQLGETIPDSLAPSNEHFIPPRLREPLEEVARMKYNPHVTVRSRGVMEKCTFCIQRINTARVETKLRDLPFIPDGYFQTACQQACPTGAIIFGDIYDYESERPDGGKGSRVAASRASGRAYDLLSFLNTRPRTSHLVRVRNPNPRLRTPVEDPFHHDHHGDHHEGDSHEHGHEAHSMSLPILDHRHACAGAQGVMA